VVEGTQVIHLWCEKVKESCAADGLAMFLRTICAREFYEGRSLWPCGLRHELSSLARILGPWVRNRLKAWMSVCVYSVFVLFYV
jgi:hypothetical protein